MRGSQTAGDKLRRREGNNPDSQEVGLEAATLQRKRNSSLVKWLRADNVTGLKRDTEAADLETLRGIEVVGERSQRVEVGPRGSVDR